MAGKWFTSREWPRRPIIRSKPKLGNIGSTKWYEGCLTLWWQRLKGSSSSLWHVTSACLRRSASAETSQLWPSSAASLQPWGGRDTVTSSRHCTSAIGRAQRYDVSNEPARRRVQLQVSAEAEKQHWKWWEQLQFRQGTARVCGNNEEEKVKWKYKDQRTASFFTCKDIEISTFAASYLLDPLSQPPLPLSYCCR